MGAAFRTKKSTDAFYHIKLGHDRIGSCWEREGVWRAKIEFRGHVLTTEPEVEYLNRRAAFECVVRQANRISICGENDERKAADALREQNEIVRERVDAMNEAAGARVARVSSSRVLV